MRATANFVRTADQTSSARSFVRGTLARWGVQSRVDDVVLMASELFTNAVLHGAGDVGMVVDVRGDRLRLEVVDEGGPPADAETRFVAPARPPPPQIVDGRGLAIVDQLSHAWGNRHDEQGRTVVWLEVPFEPPS